ASSKLFLPVVRLARLSGDRDRARLRLGLGRAARAGLHVLDPELRHRHSAARSADAALARGRVSRLPGAYLEIFPAAANRLTGVVMNLIAQTISAAEHIPLPDLVVRTGIRTLVGRTAERLARGDAGSDASFALVMAQRAIAEDTAVANAQHYEVPA